MRALVVILAISLLLSSEAKAQTEFGVYAGPDKYGVKGVSRFVGWYGKPVDRVLDFAPDNTWSDLVRGANAVAYAWFLASPPNANGKRKLRQLTLSLPLVVNGSTIAEVASGADNPHFAQVGAGLVHLGYNNAYIRLAWEFSGNWYPWSAQKDLHNWVPAFQQAVTALRSTTGQNFKIVWCIASGNAPEKLESLYPGDSYVDIIAADVYNMNWSVPAPPPAVRWQSILRGYTQFGEYGLTWLAKFGKLHNKPIAIPEWGTGNYTPLNKGVNPGGGDDPTYINSMASWIIENHVAFSHYFNAASANYDTTIDTGLFPLAAAALAANHDKLTSTR